MCPGMLTIAAARHRGQKSSWVGQTRRLKSRTVALSQAPRLFCTAAPPSWLSLAAGGSLLVPGAAVVPPHPRMLGCPGLHCLGLPCPTLGPSYGDSSELLSCFPLSHSSLYLDLWGTPPLFSVQSTALCTLKPGLPGSAVSCSAGLFLTSATSVLDFLMAPPLPYIPNSPFLSQAAHPTAQPHLPACVVVGFPEPCCPSFLPTVLSSTRSPGLV